MPKAKKPKAKKDVVITDEQKIEKVEKLAELYENMLEQKLLHLFSQIVGYVSASGLPLVHINMVLDLVKKDLIEQAYDGYLKRGK